MYKVLEIREYDEVITKKTCEDSLHLKVNHIIIAICINEDTNKRERAIFEKGYEHTVCGMTYYGGYAGDYDLLIAGDRFEIEETSTYPVVRIIN